MSRLKVDLLLADSVIGAAERGRRLESLGVDGGFTFENSHDLFLPLAAAAPVCNLDLFTNVAIAFARSPMILAHTAWDLQLLSEGRFRLGLGTQVRPHVENRFGAHWGKPVDQMREWIRAIRAIHATWQHGSPLRFEGEYTRHTLMTVAFNPGPNPYGPPPLLLGALGPRMTRLAAEEADGLLVMPFNSERHVTRRTMPAIEAGLDASGRERSDLEVTVEVIAAVGRNDEELAEAQVARWLLAFYGSTPAYRGVLDVEGRGELQTELNRLSKAGDWPGMAAMIDDELFETIAVVGSPAQCAAEIHRRYGAIADRVCIYFPGYEPPEETVRELVAELGAAQG